MAPLLATVGGDGDSGTISTQGMAARASCS